MDLNERINQLMAENDRFRNNVKMHRDAEANWEKLMMQLVGEDGLGSVSDAINLMKLKLSNQDVMIAANLGVIGQIKKAAFELGYHDSMEVTELDYLIETARASVMVNQKNVELQAQLVAVQDSVVHGKCANSEPCATFCEAIATRKMFKQLQVERDAYRKLADSMAALIVKHKRIFTSKELKGAESHLSAHDAEVSRAAFISGATDAAAFISLKIQQGETDIDLDAGKAADKYIAEQASKVGS